MIGQYQQNHGFDHGDSTGQDAGIVPSAATQNDILAGLVDAVLIGQQGCDRFETHAEYDIFSIADAALYPSTVVCGRPDAATFSGKCIVVF